MVPRIPGLFAALGDFSSFGLLLRSSSLNCLEDRLPHSKKGLEDPRCVEIVLECSSGRMGSAVCFRLLVGLCRDASGISQASELKRIEVKRAVRSGKKFPIELLLVMHSGGWKVVLLAALSYLRLPEVRTHSE